MLGRVLHLLPQVPDVHGDGVIVLIIVLVLPDLVEELLGAHHLTLALEQNPQNFKLGGRK